MPAVATVMALGLAFIAASRSAMVWYGVFTPTASTDTLATLRNSSQSFSPIRPK